jgi:hypothetical protein
VVCLKTFGEWYQKTNKTGDTNKLTLLAFKIIAILHNTRLATLIKLLETLSKGFFRDRPLSRVLGLSHAANHESNVFLILKATSVCRTCDPGGS